MEEETPGAVRAAEIICQHAYDPSGTDNRRFNTGYGTKTVKGIAAIIDRHTCTAELVAALEVAIEDLEYWQNDNNELGEPYIATERAIAGAQAAIAKARGHA